MRGDRASRQLRILQPAGFSVVELLLVVGIMGVVMGMAVLQMGSSRASFKGDGAMRVVLSQMTQARELAITQRRNMRLSFDTGNRVRIIREEVPGPTLTTISTTFFEGGLQYVTVVSSDTPDLYSGGTPTGPVLFGTATEIKFTPNGQLVDQNGASLNGTVFVGLPNQALSGRAVTIMGSTGRIRGYRWDGGGWRPV